VLKCRSVCFMSGGGILENILRGSQEVRYRGGGVVVFVHLSAVCGLLSAAALLAGLFVGWIWVAVAVLVRLVVVHRLLFQQWLPVMAGLFLAGLEGRMLSIYQVWWPTFYLSQLYYHN
jgi:hypothetical protein